MTNLIPVTIGNVVRAPQLDKNYVGYSGWTSKIYREGTTDQKAWIDFYVNEQGYVSRLNIALLNVEDLNVEDGQSFGGLLGATLASLGVEDEEEYSKFVRNLWNKVQAANADTMSIRDSIYCRAKRRYFDLNFYSCKNGHLHVDITGRI